MARKKNSLLRMLIPLVSVLIGAGVVISVAVNSSNQNATPTTAPDADGEVPQIAQADPEQAETEDSGSGQADPSQITDQDETGETVAGLTQPDQTQSDDAQTDDADSGPEPTTPDPVATEQSDAAPTSGWRARVFPEIAHAAPIGSLDGEGGHQLYAEFSNLGAGIASLQLGQGFFASVDSEDHVELQAVRVVPREGRSDLSAIPFTALSISVDNGNPIVLATPGVWQPIDGEPGSFEAIIEDGAGTPMLRLVRRYELIPGTFRLTMTRRTENLTSTPMTVRWSIAGPIDLPKDKTTYGGDKRRLRFGYLQNEKLQAGDTTVTADGDLAGRGKKLGDKSKDDQGFSRYEASRALWPTKKTTDRGQRLVWTAFTSRYFAVALHPIYDPTTVTPGGGEKVFAEAEQIDRLVLNPYATDKRGVDAVMVMRVGTVPERVEAGSAIESSMGVYAGPLIESSFQDGGLLESLNLRGLVVYNFGGFCGELCTFSWLTHVLLAVLRFAHGVVGDWALSIIILVLIVRTALHPITRWSQIRLQRFSKQMQALGPKQQKLRERYGDDSKKMQSEMARLWQEEGINPAGALGCLPLLLQSPVWIALYATLYFATEMRHEAGFYGIFQTISGGNWRFLADLSSPDAALPLPSFMHFTPPLLGGLYGRVESVNLLPILMAVLFYVHQKFLSPPPSASMTPEQEQQQKIIRIMFPIMMPLFMYPAPSGLCVYFITNSALAIIENKHIRSSAEKKGLLDVDKIKAEKAAKRKASGGGGFLSRMQAIAEERQQQMQAQQGKKKVANTSRPKPEPKSRNYKKRK